MPLTETNALISICLIAAQADGLATSRESDAIARALQRIDAQGSDIAGLQRSIASGEITIRDCVNALISSDSRQLAYELASGICAADGELLNTESAFLSMLSRELGLSPAAAEPVNAAARSVGASQPSVSAVAPLVASIPAADASDASIQNYAMLCAAVELLPQSLATAAIIPLQMKMVYEIGKRHGVELDKGHIKDFLLTIGVGATSQIVEGFARKLLTGTIKSAAGSIFGSTLGGIAGTIVNKATGPAITFGTTYALGKVAQQYYAGGRKLSAIDLQSLFRSESAKAESLYDRVAPQVHAQASRLNPTQLLNMVR
jgi:uncharacterized protein (DUF697 family)/tellurite resistance protein